MREHSYVLSRRALIGAAAFAGAAACLAGITPDRAFATPTAAEKQAEAAAALDSLNAMQEELNLASNRYDEAIAAQEEAQARMDEAQARIEEASAEIAELQTKLGNRARSMYRSGSTTFIDLLLGATTFRAFTTNWDLLNDMNEDDAAMVQQTKDLRAEVEEEKAIFTEQERVCAEKTEEARQVREEAEALVAEMQATYDSLSAEAAELLEQERAARDAAAAAAALAEIERNQGGGGGWNSAPAPSYNVSTGNAIVDRAYGWVGNADYVWGACSPGAFDCSGFVSYCVSGAYSRMGTTYTFLTWPRVSDPQPGDICVNEGHCGVYIGGGQMIHAATYGVGVIIGGVQGGMVYVRP